MRLGPIFTLETNIQTNNECLPKFVQTHNASSSIKTANIGVIEFIFFGINIFLALLKAHFNPGLTARAKMSLSRAQNIFMPANINSIVLSTRRTNLRKICFKDTIKGL